MAEQKKTNEALNVEDALTQSEAFLIKNKKTIIEGEKLIPDFIGFLSSLVGPSRTAKNRIGYVINAIKKKTRES